MLVSQFVKLSTTSLIRTITIKYFSKNILLAVVAVVGNSTQMVRDFGS